ncbi:MAG: hypothetical protein R3B90_04085 [Planctomycetaceae bacterium]
MHDPTAILDGDHADVLPWQRLARWRDACGERAEAELTVTLAAGERQTSVHLLFSPPLAGRPEVECEPLDDSDVELTIGAAHAYGIRIDVRRSGDLSAPMLFRIGAQASVSESAAAA